jgi:hypothetical protein
LDKLKAFVDCEPVSAIDPELRGVLASIGIIIADRAQAEEDRSKIGRA